MRLTIKEIIAEVDTDHECGLVVWMLGTAVEQCVGCIMHEAMSAYSAQVTRPYTATP